MTGRAIARGTYRLRAPRAGVSRGDERVDEAVDVVPLGLDVRLEPVLAQRRRWSPARSRQARPVERARRRRVERGTRTVEEEVKVT